MSIEKPLCFLIIDDCPEDREILIKHLQQNYDCCYFEAQTGAEAMNMLHNLCFDIILVDYHLPDNNGIELLEEIKLHFHTREMRSIMITGKGTEDIKAIALRRGFDNFLYKENLLAETLHTAIQETLNKVEVPEPELDENTNYLKNLEEKLLHYQDNLIQYSGIFELGTLTAQIIHEVNNPLLVLKHNINFLKKSRDNQPDKPVILQDDILNDLSSSLNRLDKFISSLKLYNQKINLSPTPELFSPEKFRNEIDSWIHLRTKQKNLIHSITIIHEWEEKALVFADPLHVYQIIINLLSNAIDAVSENGIISVECKIHSEKITRISIGNSGTTIPHEFQEKIFDPFFSTKKTESNSGSGLGLSLSQKLARMNNGSLHLDSNSSGLTTFVLAFPSRNLDEKELNKMKI